MTEVQRLFLAQARANHQLFELLRRKHPELPHCHALYHLQMATELLGKAHERRAKAKKPPPAGYAGEKAAEVKLTHKALVDFLKRVKDEKRARKHLGYENSGAQWEGIFKTAGPIAADIEALAPALAKDRPNPEYPWPPQNPIHAPAEYDFPLWQKLSGTASGRQFLDFLTRLFAAADAYL